MAYYYYYLFVCWICIEGNEVVQWLKLLFLCFLISSLLTSIQAVIAFGENFLLESAFMPFMPSLTASSLMLH